MKKPAKKSSVTDLTYTVSIDFTGINKIIEKAIKDILEGVAASVREKAVEVVKTTAKKRKT